MSMASSFIADYTFSSTYAPSDSTSSFVEINGTTLCIDSDRTVTNSTDTGTKGEICKDADYIYVCTATNTWKRAALSTY